MKKFLKTSNRASGETTATVSPVHAAGQVPFLFKQPAMVRLTGQTLRPGGLHLTDRAVDFCGFAAGDRVLDAGCGYGVTGRYLSDEFGIRVVGIDISIDRAVDRNKRHGTGRPSSVFPELLQARIPGLPFGEDTFKGIFCECVFSLVQEKSHSLGEFYRILRPGGHLVLSDLYIPEKYLSAVRQYQGDGPFTSCMEGAMGIIDLIRLLENAGFTITLMEDHTRFLKQLAGQIVFECGSLDRFWDALPGAAGCGHLTHLCRTGSLKLGYGLFVATKYH